MENIREKGKGIFIVLEGIDGSGQTTQANLLGKKLRERGYSLSISGEPTDNLIGGLIRGQLTHEWKARQECLQLLFAADRSHHLERDMFPTLNRGGIVITTRYFYSSMAYGSLDLPMEWIKKVNSRFPNADLGFYLDIPVETSLKRMSERPSRELFEKKEYLEKIRENYLKITKERDELEKIDGTQSIETVTDELMNRIDRYIEEKNPYLLKK